MRDNDLRLLALDGGGVRGLLRYAPTHDHAPKMLAARGTHLGLIPHPAAEPSPWIVLVEGPPDMISARSQGLPALAVPGDDAWEPFQKSYDLLEVGWFDKAYFGERGYNTAGEWVVIREGLSGPFSKRLVAFVKSRPDQFITG